MKKILLLGTGGTIACVPSDDGLIPALDGETLLSLVPLRDDERAQLTVDCLQIMNLDSSNLEPHHWQKLAASILQFYDAYDGIVITHGTDTMAYTAAALSQMLENCAKPIVLTGAQLPMLAPGSDAPNNLRRALLAVLDDVQGISLAFGELLIHAACAKKVYTEDFEGFESINRDPLAIWDDDADAWQWLKLFDYCGAAWGTGDFRIRPALETKVTVIKIIPGSTPDILDYYAEHGYKGIIIEGFGAGGVPNADNNWLPAVERLLQQGIKVVCQTQCTYDGVHLDKYPIGILAERLGAQSAGPDTLETSVAKLMWQLANE